MVQVQVQVRDCAGEDTGLLEAAMPSRGIDVHAALFARQQQGEATYLVAWSGRRPIGTVVVRWQGYRNRRSRAAIPGIPVISNLGVIESERGRGVGTALMRAAEQRILAASHHEVALAVGIDNPRALALYLRLSYLDTGLRELDSYDYPDETGTLRRMEEENLLLRKAIRPSGSESG